jgi:hypothetical protein
MKTATRSRHKKLWLILVVLTSAASTFSTANQGILADEISKNSSPAKMPDSAEAEKTGPKPKAMMITGRLEQVGGKNSSLPLGLTLKGLKALAGHLDPSVLTPKQSSQISYPRAWTGQWGGNLRVDRLTSTAGDVQSVFGFNRGETGVVVFSFMPQSSKIVCVPTDIFFSRRDVPVEKVAWSAEQMAELQRSPGVQQTYKGSPMVFLRCNLEFHRVNGVQENRVVLLNTAKNLSENVIEQNAVVGLRSVDPATKQPIDRFSEVVIRLTANPQRPNLLLCQLAQVEYDEKGQAQNSSYLQGWLSPNWRSCASEIERRTGWTVAKLGYTELCSAMNETAASGSSSKQ